MWVPESQGGEILRQIVAKLSVLWWNLANAKEAISPLTKLLLFLLFFHWIFFHIGSGGQAPGLLNMQLVCCDCSDVFCLQHKCYIVATCDKDLKRRIRKIPGIPIMYISQHRLVHFCYSISGKERVFCIYFIHCLKPDAEFEKNRWSW